MSDLTPFLERLRRMEPVSWINERRLSASESLQKKTLGMRDVKDAASRWERFAPLLSTLFPETGDGIVESPLRRVQSYEKSEGLTAPCFAKCDNALPVAGSVKARGGMYEVLTVAERIALERRLLKGVDDDYRQLALPEAKRVFASCEIAVGSTGNLGLSIGLTASALGFSATVHMSADAKEWKKALLRSKGVRVVEYAEDYSAAVAAGRAACAANPDCHFVDDERSKELFLGYSVAAMRMERQLRECGVEVDDAHPLHVFLPCGVGGAPGGIAFGLKHIYGDAVKCFFVEPTHAPCMLLAMLSGSAEVRVRDFGIDGITEADGLAVGTPSAFVYCVIGDLVDGFCTVGDEELHPLLAKLWESEGVKIEPSAATALAAIQRFPAPFGGTNVAWLTGGSFVPDPLFAEMVARGRGVRHPQYAF